MKKILLVGKLLKSVPSKNELMVKDVDYFAAADLDEVKKIFSDHSNAIDIVIMGAGIELNKRLEIVDYIFKASNTTSVHMKDWETGPGGFVPFINHVLTGLLQNE